MFVNPTCPNQVDYNTFLTNQVQIPAVSLPPSFVGAGLLNTPQVLTINAVTSGALYPGPALTDANGYLLPNTVVTQQIDGITGSLGDYSIGPPATQVTGTENITAFNYQIYTTLNVAMDWVNTQLLTSPNLYVLAVYNLAADRLINYGIDIPGQTYFAGLRTDYGINLRTAGIVSATSDNGTSSSYVNPEFMKNLTFEDLQMAKTPWGRAYLGIAQAVGSLWGIS